MLSGKHMTLSVHQALSIAAKSYMNGESLLEDARVLFANERWPRVIFMCCIAQEELSKTILSIAAATKIRLGEFDSSAEKQYREQFRTHRMKTATLSAVLDFFFSMRPHMEIVKTLHDGDPRSKDQETVKLGALYADFDGGGVRSPVDVLPNRIKVEPTLNWTSELFVMASANIVPLFDEIETCDIEQCRAWMHNLRGVL